MFLGLSSDSRGTPFAELLQLHVPRNSPGKPPVLRRAQECSDAGKPFFSARVVSGIPSCAFKFFRKPDAMSLKSSIREAHRPLEGDRLALGPFGSSERPAAAAAGKSAGFRQSKQSSSTCGKERIIQ